MRTPSLPLAAVVLALGLAAAPAPAQTEDIQQTTTDLLVFRKYLANKYPDKKWQAGPARLDSKEIRTAYSGRRFYYVFSAPPLPPGANLPRVQEAYRQRLQEFGKTYISVTASFDGAGKITELGRSDDFNVGLMKVQGDEDAKVAGAAVLSLFGQFRVGPGVVPAKDVTVSRTKQGWSCQVRTRTYQGTVAFDAAGHCTSVSKVYIGPLPP